jgi:hypothetical protein
MQKEFFREYLKPDNSSLRQLLYVLNPNKFQVSQNSSRASFNAFQDG